MFKSSAHLSSCYLCLTVSMNGSIPTPQHAASALSVDLHIINSHAAHQCFHADIVLSIHHFHLLFLIFSSSSSPKCLFFPLFSSPLLSSSSSNGHLPWSQFIIVFSHSSSSLLSPTHLSSSFSSSTSFFWMWGLALYFSICSLHLFPFLLTDSSPSFFSFTIPLLLLLSSLLSFLLNLLSSFLFF